MAGIDTLIAEDSPDLVDALHTTHDEPLEIEFGGDTKLHLRIECIHLREERPCGGTAGDVQ